MTTKKNSDPKGRNFTEEDFAPVIAAIEDSVEKELISEEDGYFQTQLLDYLKDKPVLSAMILVSGIAGGMKYEELKVLTAGLMHLCRIKENE